MEDVWIIVILCVSIIVAVPAIALVMWCCDDGRLDRTDNVQDDVDAMIIMANN